MNNRSSKQEQTAAPVTRRAAAVLFVYCIQVMYVVLVLLQCKLSKIASSTDLTVKKNKKTWKDLDFKDEA